MQSAGCIGLELALSTMSQVKRDISILPNQVLILSSEDWMFTMLFSIEIKEDRMAQLGKTPKGDPTDLAYKEPFSERTQRVKRQVVLWSVVSLLNYFYTIDLANSHVLGLKFSAGIQPPFAALMAVIVLYFFFSFLVYGYQELMSWLAQASELQFVKYQEWLHEAQRQTHNVGKALDNFAHNIKYHAEKVDAVKGCIDGLEDDYQDGMKSHIHNAEVARNTLMGARNDIAGYRDNYLRELNEAESKLSDMTSRYSAAMRSQLLKVFGFDILFPVFLAVAALVYSWIELIGLFRQIF